MKLREAIDQYVGWRRNHGSKFESETVIFNLFMKYVGTDIHCDKVTEDQVLGFLAGDRPPTGYRAVKYAAVSGFYSYAISRGYASTSPIPDNEPRRIRPRPPYIYSQKELFRLFGAIEASRKHSIKLDAHTFRTLLLLLYGAGLRRSEAFKLSLEDVNLSAGVLSVRSSKFHKSRLVPVGPQLGKVLRDYAALRADRPAREGGHSAFLVNRDGTPLTKGGVAWAFAGLLRTAGIQNANTARRNPSLHSFRHSFAVHRVSAWYRQDADVQRLLPALSAYLGHTKLSYTQVYLSMTPELLQQASLRLERYVRGGNHEK